MTTLFKRYEYNPQTDLIGKGGFSRVYRALDLQQHMLLALKIYKISNFSERLIAMSEKQRLLELKHPNICRYFDIQQMEQEDAFGEVEKIQVCTMELLEKGNLAAFYARNPDPQQLAPLVGDILNGLDYLHQNHIIHKDIKPANLLIKESDGNTTAMITDFGFSKKSASSDSTSSSTLVAAVPYMAPEQLNAQKYGIDQKVQSNIDLWSLGVSVYEILTGDLLFKNNDRDSAEQIIANILAPGVPEKIQSLPAPFNELVSQCIVKDAKVRCRNAGELLEWLKPYLDGKASVEEKTEQPVPVPSAVEPEEEPGVSLPLPETQIPEDETRVLISSEDTAAIPASLLPAIETLQPVQPEPGIPDDEDTRILERTEQVVSTPADDAPEETKKIFPSPPSPAAADTVGEPTSSAHEVTGPAHDEQETMAMNPTGPSNETAKITLFHRYDYYPVTDLIGKGGFSRVYKAFDTKLNRWVALKIYKTNEFSERYSPIAEIRRVVNLDHPNICRYLDIEEIEKVNPFGETEKIQVCVMELLDSGNFLDYFNKSGKDLGVLKKLLQDVLQGIAYLHKNGIIHRDIKPANILIKKGIEGAVAKITDFGISKVSDSHNNSTSALVVSIPYMAPEQLNAVKYGIQGKIWFNLDLWSLGVTVYEVITGKVLFKNSEQDSSEQIMANILANELPEKIEELPQPFRNVVSLCLVKNANERAQRAEDLLARLHSADTTAISVAPAPPLVHTQPAETPAPKPEVIQPAPEYPDKLASRGRFVVAAPEPVLEKRAKKHISVLKISVAAAALLLIISSFFYYRIVKDEKRAAAIPPHTDTTKRITPPILPPNPQTGTVQARDTSGSAPSRPGKPPAAVTQSNRDKGGNKPEKIKDNRTVTDDSRERVGRPQSVDKLLVFLVVSEPCTVKKDMTELGKVHPRQTFQIPLGTGTYLISAVNEEGKTFRREITVTEAQLGRKQNLAIYF